MWSEKTYLHLFTRLLFFKLAQPTITFSDNKHKITTSILTLINHKALDSWFLFYITWL